MATFKHISSKNADYGAAEAYLTFEHDEFTMKPTLDENGRLIPREDYRISSLNCGGEDFAVACMRANLRYEKNQKREDVKSHHYGYKVRWEPNQKYITYTTPENIRCRDNKLFDQTLLRSSMEAYFDMGGCEYLESRIDATEYGELLPTVDDAVCGLISILDAMNTGDNNRFHLETLHHSKQEIRRILERGGKIDRTVEYAVDDEEEEYEQYHGFSMRM